jgi:hypothetical protein
MLMLIGQQTESVCLQPCYSVLTQGNVLVDVGVARDLVLVNLLTALVSDDRDVIICSMCMQAFAIWRQMHVVW